VETAPSLHSILEAHGDRASTAMRIAEWIANERRYRWVGLYEVTASEIGMISCTGSEPPAFPRFPLTRGLCGAAVASKSIVNVGNVQADPRWLTTFGSTRSEIIVPVFAPDSRVAGLIDVESDSLNAFSGSDEQFLSHCATIISSLF
jgi:L-methionine (R)-S-oxide reductase